jgi:hypothetical protein
MVELLLRWNLNCQFVAQSLCALSTLPTLESTAHHMFHLPAPFGSAMAQVFKPYTHHEEVRSSVLHVPRSHLIQGLLFNAAGTPMLPVRP